MSSGKIAALIVIALAVGGMYLETQSKLIPVLDATLAANQGQTSVWRWLIAAACLLVIMSFLPPEDDIYLVVALVLGGLLYDQKHNGDKSLMSQLSGTPKS